MKIKVVCAWLFVNIVCVSLERGNSGEELTKTQNGYADGYGSKFIYFPDGDGILHLVNLTDTYEVLPSIRMDSQLQFKLYTKLSISLVLLTLKDGWSSALRSITFLFDIQQYLYTFLATSCFPRALVLAVSFSDTNSSGFVDLDNYGQPLNNDTNIGQYLRNKPLKVVTHGWMSRASQSAVMDITQAYMRARTDVSVVTVDWSSISVNLLYPSVASQTREVGLRVAQFLNAVHKRYDLEAQATHLIGHSLGAHVMGIAGYQSKFPIGRVTGLDPALPTFDDVQKEKTRVDSNDATFVDVIHTCGGVLGFLDAIGTADYYPNSGTAPQPGCNVFKNVFEIGNCL